MNEPLRVLLAAGGTGGHIYPALALADALREASPGCEILFVCGDRPGELAIYRGRGIEPRALPLSGRRRGVANTIRFAREFGASMLLARRIAREFRPRVAVGFGNYLSAPALWAARRAGARLAIHEQNAHPGVANRWLARACDLVLTGAPVPAGRFPAERTRLVGNPVRRDLLVPAGADERAAARRAFGLPESGPALLCFGGSLGAAGVNRMLSRALPEFAAARPEWSFVWASGPTQFEALRPEAEALAAGPLAGRLAFLPYLNDMRAAYLACDLAVTRAGALTLAELTALGKPAVLVPLPTSAGDHQRANARGLAEAGAAAVVEETAPDATARLVRALVELADDPGRLAVMAESARALGRPDAAERMAEAVLSIARA